MKQVKELSLVRCVSDSTSCNELASGSYAIGFSSTSFLIWNLMTEAKVHSLNFFQVIHMFACLNFILEQVIQVVCGGWRRPYSYYLGDEPEMKNCFAFVKVCFFLTHFFLKKFEK